MEKGTYRIVARKCVKCGEVQEIWDEKQAIVREVRDCMHATHKELWDAAANHPKGFGAPFAGFAAKVDEETFKKYGINYWEQTACHKTSSQSAESPTESK